MKCPYCGGEVALEDKECPYCGRPNEQSAGHRKDMERYQKRFSAAEKTVAGKTKGYTRILPRVLVILFLVIAIVAMAVISEQAWQFPENGRRRAAERNAEAVCETMDGFLDRGEYSAFVSYAEHQNIRMYYGETFSEYGDVYYCANYFADLVYDMEKLYLRRDQEEWQKWDKAGDMRMLSSGIINFFETVSYTEGRSDLSERGRGWVADMRETMTGMLDYYLGLDEEKLSEYLSLPENRRVVYLEEAIFGE